MRFAKRAAARAIGLDWLDLEKAPFFVSIFFAALAWTFVRTVDHFSASSYIEYRIIPGSDSFAETTNAPVVGIRLRNLGKIAHDCPLTLLAIPGGSSLQFKEVVKPKYRIYGQSYVDAQAIVDQEMGQAQLTLKQFDPGAEVEFGLVTKGSGPIYLRLIRSKPADCAGAAREQTDVPVLAQRSPKTILVANQMAALWLGLAAWAALLIALSAARRRRAIHPQEA